MKATRKLYELGQSLWLDNITRGLLVSGTLHRYIQDFSVTGLTSNPTIFDHAIKNSQDYDDAIRQKVSAGKLGEALFFELAIEDLRQAADLFRPIHDRTNSVDGWVSLEVSPLLAHDTSGTLAAAVASLFVSRWDVAVADKAPAELRNRLGIAIAGQVYESYRNALDSPRWQRIFNAGARAQRLLFASTGTKDLKASDTLYIESLAAPFTVNTMPEATLKALADHGTIGDALPAHIENALGRFTKAGIDTDALGSQLQNEGAASFVKSWKDLMECIASKSKGLKAA
jgi:transaldolase